MQQSISRHAQQVKLSYYKWAGNRVVHQARFGCVEHCLANVRSRWRADISSKLGVIR